MKDVSYPRAGTYVVAVSGGVDSVVLLELLSRQGNLKLIVAHVDHGIREDSAKSAHFVKELAGKYNLSYRQVRLTLGEDAGEEVARQKRYAYLRRLVRETKADAVITAHHADDVVETMVINLLRGTGWRGLASLASTDEIIRPLLACRKASLIRYAKDYGLNWHHDSTNDSVKYTRNYVRRHITPKLHHDDWYKMYQTQLQLRTAIDSEVQNIRSFRRYDYIMWPRSVALEILRSFLPLTRLQAEYALHAIKTMKSGKVVEVGSGFKIVFNRDDFIVVDPVS